MPNFFTKLLWAIAGAETSILKDCRTDHKKYSAMGATILMTAFIAFLSGTSAAWFFTQKGAESSGNLGWSIAFGVIWSLLIFCIDRSLVITMKKPIGDGDSWLKRKTWWIVPFVTRLLLAGLIALVVSVPLELVIFEDYIQEQKFVWTESKANNLSEKSVAQKTSDEANKHIETGNSHLTRLDKQREELEGAKGDLQQQLSAERAKLNKPTTSAYKKAFDNLKATNEKISKIKHQLSTTEDEKSRRNLNSNLSDLEKKRNQYASVVNSEKEKWNSVIYERIKTLNEEISNKTDEISKKSQEQEDAQKLLIQSEKRYAEATAERDSMLDAYGNTVSQGNHFIQNFEILEYAVSVPTEEACPECSGIKADDEHTCLSCGGDGHKLSHSMEYYALWLIRLLFLIIEILPTIVKIAMPVGVYDRMIRAEEDSMVAFLKSPEYQQRVQGLRDREMQLQEDQFIAQQKAETEARNQILKKLQEAQNDVVEAALNKWKEKELKNLVVDLQVADTSVPSEK